MVQQEKRVIKEIINRNFTFSDLSPKFKDIDSSSGNIFCPFHENHETPAAKMYWDDEKELWIIHCFGECHRNFTAFDYVEIIMCVKQQRYNSPLDFLKENMDISFLRSQYKVCEKDLQKETTSRYKEKIDYINNTYAETGNIECFIECLYTR